MRKGVTPLVQGTRCPLSFKLAPSVSLSWQDQLCFVASVSCRVRPRRATSPPCSFCNALQRGFQPQSADLRSPQPIGRDQPLLVLYHSCASLTRIAKLLRLWSPCLMVLCLSRGRCFPTEGVRMRRPVSGSPLFPHRSRISVIALHCRSANHNSGECHLWSNRIWTIKAYFTYEDG